MKTCECGCGLPTPVAKVARRGYQKGESMHFIRGHYARVNNPMKTNAARQKVAASKRGDLNPMRRPEVAAKAAANRRSYKGSENPNWRGGIKLGYLRAHRWLRENFQRTACESCGKTTQLHWAFLGKPGGYAKDRDSYCCLCVTCHAALDSLIRKAA